MRLHSPAPSGVTNQALLCVPGTPLDYLTCPLLAELRAPLVSQRAGYLLLEGLSAPDELNTHALAFGPKHLVVLICCTAGVSSYSHVYVNCTWAQLGATCSNNNNGGPRGGMRFIWEHTPEETTTLCQDAELTCCPSSVKPTAVCWGSFTGWKSSRWESSVPGDGEETSREETPPQTQPEAQVRVPGDARERNLWQSEEGQGTIRSTGKDRYQHSFITFYLWAKCNA